MIESNLLKQNNNKMFHLFIKGHKRSLKVKLWISESLIVLRVLKKPTFLDMTYVKKK